MAEETTHNTPNLEPTGERRESRHEFDLTREDILVALLEDFVISEDDPGYPDDPRTLRLCKRVFRTVHGDELTASGIPFWIDSGGTRMRWNWGIYASRSSETELLSLRISPDYFTPDPRGPYRAVQDERDGTHVPLSSDEVTQLIALVASMTPVSDTTYKLGVSEQDRPAEIE